jgi:hypothetical protein
VDLPPGTLIVLAVIGIGLLVLLWLRLRAEVTPPEGPPAAGPGPASDDPTAPVSPAAPPPPPGGVAPPPSSSSVQVFPVAGPEGGAAAAIPEDATVAVGRAESTDDVVDPGRPDDPDDLGSLLDRRAGDSS